MLNALAQTTYTYTTVSDETAAGVFAGTFLLVMMLILLPLIIFYIVCLWKTFEKAGVEGWKAIVPFYNFWVLCEIAGKPGWWSLVVLLSFIPVINLVGWIAILVVQVLISIEVAKAFGKDSVFALLLIFLPVVGYAILGFGDAKYHKPAGGASGGQGPTKPAAPAKA